MGRSYIYDVNTPNISFIQTAVDLKKLGIKNNMFFLKLYDPSLQGVDPFSPFISDDLILRIVNECIVNPWYFLRECVRIPDQGNTAGISYQLNRANLASAWCLLHGIDNYLVIPRQIGKTQSTLAIIDWAFLFGTTNSEMMFLNMLAERAIENLGRLKDQRDLLPKYLQFKLAFDDEGNEIKATDNVKTLKNAANGNSIVTKPSARSIEAAERIGRGSTQVIQYYDEFEFTNCIKTIVEAAGPAFATASENARRNGALYGRVFTSTPGDLDSSAGQEALSIIEETCKWTEKFYDMNIEDVKDYVATNSGNNIVYIEYQYQQLGKDEAWFNKVCSLLNNNKLKIQREIFLKRIHGSSQSPYELEDLQAIEDLRGTIREEIFINKIFKLDVYEPLVKNQIYFVGVDVASGYGADNSAVTVFNPYTLKTVAEFKSSNIGVKNLIQFLYILIRRHLPSSILAIERNHNGEAVLDHLRDTDIRGNIYYDNTKDPTSDLDEKVDDAGFLKVEAAKRKLYGIWTGPKSRELMFGLLDTFIKEHKESFVGNNIISDIMKLVRTKTGKIEAQVGFHDDSIMSFLMCLYLYYYGNNLSRYGFSRGSLPNTEQQNKGMDYSELVSMMSETDKKFFGIDEDTDNPYADMDIQSMIEQSRHGLIDEQELKSGLSENGPVKTIKSPNISQLDPYSMKLYKEMLAASKESEAFDKRINFKSSYQTLDDDMSDDVDFDPGLFTDLNS